jgi:hypothetical protein
MRMFGVPYFLVYVVAIGCAAPKATTTSSSTASSSGYTEDLSLLRPKTQAGTVDTAVTKTPEGIKKTTYVEPKMAVNAEIDAVLDSIDQLNIARKYVDGFTVQVFSGKREDAMNVRKQLNSLVPEITSEIQFTEPIFRLKAGKYFNWIDAQADYALIKRYFPAAIVIPEKIPLPQ